MDKSRNVTQVLSELKFDNETYLEIWKTEQEHKRSKWSIVTFFMSVSFAILGFSFQNGLAISEASTVRIIGLIIYWFAFLIYMQQNTYNNFLRSYLLELEENELVSIKIHSKAKTYAKVKKVISLKNLLFSFGLIYTLGLIILWVIKL
jgi:hypothetical protein